MTVFELQHALNHYEWMGGDPADEIDICHDGSYAELIITDSTDKNKQVVIMGDE